VAEEIEVKFLDTDHNDIRSKLEKMGAIQTHKRTLHKRKVYDYASGLLEEKGGWVRLRDEGDKITLTYKQNNFNNSGKVIKTLEDEVIVDDYDEADRFLRSIGLKEKSTQENYREVWRVSIDGSIVDIMLDEWPFVKPFVELELVEGSRNALKELAVQLGLRFEDALEGSVIPVYMSEYNVTAQDIRDYRGPMLFNQPRPDFLKR
jgi:adenylate cyclase class 2